ncbi:MAG: radical SAM protein [Bacteriovoracaceae bacterium]|nr:radical SAM protein [Bacteriovoracaceae bacterium]
MFFNRFPIKYDPPVYRPPSEAESLLLQITIGCSHNNCTFCAMYSGKQFRVCPLDKVLTQIEKAYQYYKDAPPRKIFLCDGDALCAPADYLISILDAINNKFPDLARVGIYATANNILTKSEDELKALSSRKLEIAYLGLESGCDELLKKINKGNTASDMVDAILKLKRANWKSSVIVMLGLGGSEMSKIHCLETAKCLSKMVPNFLSFLTTTPVPGTPYYKMLQNKAISPLTTKELLIEMREIISSIDQQLNGRMIFRANHVSNMFPLAGIIPRDRNSLLTTINEWIQVCPDGVYPDVDPASL